MNTFHKMYRYLFDSNYRFIINDGFHLYKNMSDEQYLRRKFKVKLGYDLDLESPKSFNEKLQWLKLNDHNSLYHLLVDKVRVKQYVSNIIGEEYIIPNYGVWDDPNQIEWDSLPNSFVLKVSHDSGGVIVCKNKCDVDKEEIANRLKKYLKRDYYYSNREWPYKSVERKVLAEQLLLDPVNPELIDYKFYCFNGEPKYLYISKGLTNHQTASISFLTLDWKAAQFSRSDYKQFDVIPQRPECFDEMINIAYQLSEGFPFLRVDLYCVSHKVYFSELTLYPCSGMMPFEPKQYDYILGNLLNIDSLLSKK